eukprot:TRINITY_DN11317_c0_g1_i1.p1 TRINITY_DN11317_c0_g1~~TRINITY_DN11317_c0_g1_i1.p1  ORF type:complete len:320 (+),score=78.84 TRINITY_DN11317_c0_g1_i1:62-961(+)
MCIRDSYYNVKLLQMAWMKNLREQELSAYDRIGIMFFYLGELEKANFFHQRMMDGIVEPKDSPLRLLGIAQMQLLQKQSEMDKDELLPNKKLLKNEEEIDEEEEEYDLNLPTEMFLSAKDSSNKLMQRTQSTILTSKSLQNKELLMGIGKIGYYKKTVAQRAQQKVISHVRANSTSYGFGELDDGFGRSSQVNIKGMTTHRMDEVLVSHLSPNRHMQMFYLGSIRQQQKAVGHGLLREQLDILDLKSVDRIFRVLEKYKTNLILALSRVLQAQGRRILPKAPTQIGKRQGIRIKLTDHA